MMKKVLFLLVFVLVSIGLSAKVVRPVKYNWTVDHIPDGRYYVIVDWNTVKAVKDGCYLTFEVLLPERYTAKMLEELKDGDYIEIGGKMQKVRNKRLQDGMYNINYEEDNEYSGISFSGCYIKGYYIACNEVIPPEEYYCSYGKVPLKVNKFRTNSEYDVKYVVEGAKIANYILKNWKKEYFRNFDYSHITVKNGKVVLLESSCAD